MSINLILPFLAAAVMVLFTGFVLQRYVVRRKFHFLFWGIGLALFALGSFSEAILAIGWNQWVFFAWYLSGAVLTAAWIGHGTVYLLAKKRKAHILTILLVTASIIAAILLLRTMPLLDETAFSTTTPISESYSEIMPAVSEGGYVRLTTPIFNVYGLITLVGGALWSTYLFWRKRVLPNRVIGNVLIALGALTIASASTLTRLGFGSVLYLGELFAAVLMFSGFLIAAAPKSAKEPHEAPVSA